MEKLMNYKGLNIVEEKTEESKFLKTIPVFDTAKVSMDEVPVNKKLKAAFKILSNNDETPFFFISEMKLGEKHLTAYGDIMTKEWAESFVDKLDIAPFPISSLGHTNVSKPWERAESQGYVLGGKVEKESMFLLNYLLPGDTEESKELSQKTVRELKAGMLSTSISNLQKYVREYDEKTETSKWFVVESLAGQRNDIVEHDLTGSDATIVARSFKSSKDAEDKMSAKNKGEENMDKKEMMSKLLTLKANGDLSVAEIVNNFGLELVTEAMKTSETFLKAIIKEAGENTDIIAVLKEYKTLKEKLIVAEFDKIKDAALKEVFKDKEALLENATELFTLKTGTKEECDEEAKRVSNLKTIKDLASKMAGDMSKNVSFKKVGNTSSTADIVEM